MKPLTGPCHNCFALGSIYYPDYDHYACPKHADKLSQWIESKAHLLELIAPVVAAWGDHWLERGLTQKDIKSTFENLEGDLVRIVQHDEAA
jgi:hypothetical protein